MLILGGIPAGHKGMHRMVPEGSGGEPSWQGQRKLASLPHLKQPLAFSRFAVDPEVPPRSWLSMCLLHPTCTRREAPQFRDTLAWYPAATEEGGGQPLSVRVLPLHFFPLHSLSSDLDKDSQSNE